jgi:hypothetical protein
MVQALSGADLSVSSARSLGPKKPLSHACTAPSRPNPGHLSPLSSLATIPVIRRTCTILISFRHTPGYLSHSLTEQSLCHDNQPDCTTNSQTPDVVSRGQHSPQNQAQHPITSHHSCSRGPGLKSFEPNIQVLDSTAVSLRLIIPKPLYFPSQSLESAVRIQRRSPSVESPLSEFYLFGRTGDTSNPASRCFAPVTTETIAASALPQLQIPSQMRR